MADIKLFVCCHRPEGVPKHPLLYPIQVGAALTDTQFSGFLYDDSGDNISAKNHSYCELTAQYWAWKNADADYYGFFHYRRYLYPNFSEKHPYRIEVMPTAELLDKLGYKSFSGSIEGFDLIAPIGEDMHIPVRKHYANASFHHGKDLDLTEKIVRELTPEYSEATEVYLSQTVCYFGNIYIMSKPVFERYCAWLFSVLREFDQRADMAGYGPQELRVDGYLAERLFGVFYTKLKVEGAKTAELPRVHFIEDPAERGRMRAVNLLLPPGSIRRSKVKRLMR